MKRINEEISKIKSLMNLLTEETVEPKNWVKGDFYIRKVNKTNLNFDALINYVVDKNGDDLTLSSIEYNEELKIKSEENKDTLSIREIWSSVDGVSWEKSSQEKWDEIKEEFCYLTDFDNNILIYIFFMVLITTRRIFFV